MRCSLELAMWENMLWSTVYFQKMMHLIRVLSSKANKLNKHTDSIEKIRNHLDLIIRKFDSGKGEISCEFWIRELIDDSYGTLMERNTIHYRLVLYRLILLKCITRSVRCSYLFMT